MTAIEIYTDGGCQGNPGPGGWGVAVYCEGKCLLEDHGHDAQTTNNKMELTALIRGLTLAVDYVGQAKPVTLFSDSTYCVNGYKAWLLGWIKNRWIKADGQPVLNADLWIRVADLKAKLDTKPAFAVQHVRAHKGNVGNEHADRLSNKWRTDKQAKPKSAAAHDAVPVAPPAEHKDGLTGSAKRPRVVQADAPALKPSVSDRFAAFVKDSDAARDPEFDALLAKQDISAAKARFLAYYQ